MNHGRGQGRSPLRFIRPACPLQAMEDHCFILSDAKLVDQPGILFWQNDDQYFARRLDQDQWDKFIKAAKVNKKFW